MEPPCSIYLIVVTTDTRTCAMPFFFWCQRARTLNWSFSLLTLLALIVFVIPLGLCLLLTYRTRTTFGRTLLLTLVPFSLYLLTFYRFGHIVASKAVVAGSHSIGKTPPSLFFSLFFFFRDLVAQ